MNNTARQSIAQGLKKLTLDLSTHKEEAYLRRAISTAYYAVFHLFIDEGIKLLFNSDNEKIIEIATRSYSHKDMKNVCSFFYGGGVNTDGTIKDSRYKHFMVSVPFELQMIAKAFCDLQEAREVADYFKSSDNFDFNMALKVSHDLYIKYMEETFENWLKLQNDVIKKNDLMVFCALLLLSPISYKLKNTG